MNQSPMSTEIRKIFDIQRTGVGLDIGRSAVKAVVFAQGESYRLVFPSIVSLAIDLTDEQAIQKAELDTIEVSGKKYFTGDTARLQGGASMSPGLSDDWIKSDEYKALVLSAFKRLKALGVPGLDSAFVVVGTPSALYGNQRTALEKITSSVLPGREVKALSQPMGAYLSFYLDQNGIPIPDRHKDKSGRLRSWAVIEVGHFTTDFLLMKENTYIESKSDSCEGINLAGEHLSKILGAKGMKVNLLACEQALRSRTIFHFGEKKIGEDVDKALEPAVRKISSKANALFGEEAAFLDGILLAGGGAEPTEAPLKKLWPNLIPLQDPRMAVADGYCRYAKGLILKREMAASKSAEKVAANG